MNAKSGIVLGVANEKSIAYAVARKLSDQGANVIATCLNEKAYQAVYPLLADSGIELRICNVENQNELASLATYATEKFDEINFAVHSIAWAPLNDLHGRLIDSSDAGFSKAMSISCHSFARMAKLITPHMHSGGSLVTMTYLGADEVVEHYGLMGPVKAALESLVRYLSSELGPQGIRVHAVSPGPIPTRAASGIEDFDQLMKENMEKAPLRRLVTLEEVANLTEFLCSDLSSGMTGQTIYVDAGRHTVA